MFFAQSIVSQAEPVGREQIAPVAIVFKRSRLGGTQCCGLSFELDPGQPSITQRLGYPEIWGLGNTKVSASVPTQTITRPRHVHGKHEDALVIVDLLSDGNVISLI